jgi:hypothetical protein
MGWLDSLIDTVSGLFGGGGGEAATQGAGEAASSAGGMGVGDIANYAAGIPEAGSGVMSYISPESDYFTQLGGLGQQGGAAPYYLANATSYGAPAASAGTSGILSGAYNAASEGVGKAADWAQKNPALVKTGLGAGLAGGKMLSDYMNRPKMPNFNIPGMSNQTAPLTPDYTPPPGTMASPLLRQQPQVKDQGGLSKKSGGMAAF